MRSQVRVLLRPPRSSLEEPGPTGLLESPAALFSRLVLGNEVRRRAGSGQERHICGTFHGAVEVPRAQMRVVLHRQRNVAMPRQLLRGPRMHVRLGEPRHEAVSQRMAIQNTPFLVLVRDLRVVDVSSKAPMGREQACRDDRILRAIRVPLRPSGGAVGLECSNKISAQGNALLAPGLRVSGDDAYPRLHLPQLACDTPCSDGSHMSPRATSIVSRLGAACECQPSALSAARPNAKWTAPGRGQAWRPFPG